MKSKAKIWGQTRVLHWVILYQKPRCKKSLLCLRTVTLVYILLVVAAKSV